VVSGAAFGTATTTVSRVAALTLNEGAKVVWKYNGDAKTAGQVVVLGTLTLPSVATLDVGGTGFLYTGQVLLSAGATAGASDLSKWTITGAPRGSRAVLVGNQVLLRTNRGTIIGVR